MSPTHILQQISEAADAYEDWNHLELFAEHSTGAGIHIACMVEPFLEYILEGRKTIESRFSKPLIPPYRSISAGDFVLLKAGPIVASFRASTVEFVELTHGRIRQLAEDHSGAICADEEFWTARADKNYATLIGVCDVRRLTPIKVDKQDRRGWVVLRDIAAGGSANEQLVLI
jgi:hypothetical protein